MNGRILRKIITSVLAALTLAFAGTAIAQPVAQATTESVAVSQSAQAQPADINGYKFWSPSICIDASDINGQYYPISTLAQRWNIVSQGALALDYSNDCAADGYPPSRRMVVNTFSNASNPNCIVFTNTEFTGYHGFSRWTNGPGAYFNTAKSCMTSGQTIRNHWLSEGIGFLLGLQSLDSDSYNSRVMNNTSYSQVNVPQADYNSGDTMFNIYSGVYCLPAGSGC